MTLEPQQLLTMYRLMATIRTFDNRAVEEFHAGNIPGVVHAYLYTNGYRESRRSARHSCCRPAFSVPWRC